MRGWPTLNCSAGLVLSAPLESGTKYPPLSSRDVLFSTKTVWSHVRINTLIGKIFKPLVNWFVEFELRWQRDLWLQQGLAPEDKIVHEETELRRDVLFDHMARESYSIKLG